MIDRLLRIVGITVALGAAAGLSFVVAIVAVADWASRRAAKWHSSSDW